MTGDCGLSHKVKSKMNIVTWAPTLPQEKTQNTPTHIGIPKRARAHTGIDEGLTTGRWLTVSYWPLTFACVSAPPPPFLTQLTVEPT